MNESCKKSALYPWFPERGEELIHPDDLSAIVKLMPYGKVFKFCGNVNDFAVIEYGAQSFRVKPDLLRFIPNPRFEPGQEVTRNPDGGTMKVMDIFWHHEKDAPFYLVSVGAKRISRRFMESELK